MNKIMDKAVIVFVKDVKRLCRLCYNNLDLRELINGRSQVYMR